jgi:hypothetical protein
MKDFACIGHGLEPSAMLRCPLHRGEQSQQTFSVFRAGVFLQCLAEGQMLCRALRR